MIDRLITADARKVTGAEFFNALFPAPDPQRKADLAAALKDRQDAIQAVYRGRGTLADDMARIAAIKAEHAARVEEIERRYALPILDLETKALGDGRYQVAA